jgi:putative transposase
MDLVGPRYIKSDGRFYSMNVIDLYSHRVFIESNRTKEDDNIAQGLLRCWKSMGLPDFLQMDNELSFRGSNRYPRTLGLVLRLCLYFGVQPVFIPVAEPWRDGVIESFNDTYDKKFYRRQWFSSYAMLKRQSKNFQQFHNKNHRYSYLKGKTPLEVIEADEFKPLTLGPNTRMPKLDFLPDGAISLIRFIRSDRILNIFGEKFEVSKNLVYSYVRAMIVTEIHTLQVYLGEDFVQSFEYRMPTEFSS